MTVIYLPCSPAHHPSLCQGSRVSSQTSPLSPRSTWLLTLGVPHRFQPVQTGPQHLPPRLASLSPSGRFSGMGATIHPFTQTRPAVFPVPLLSLPLILSVLRSLIRNPFCSVPQSGTQLPTFLLHHLGQLDFLPVTVASCSQDGCHRSRLHGSAKWGKRMAALQ